MKSEQTTITSDQIKEAAKADGIKMESILPADWQWNADGGDFDVTDAIRSYILNRDIGENLETLLGDEPKPTHEWQSSGRGDAAYYRVYKDDSLWYENNAQDEVWWDYREFVTDNLIGGIEALNACGGGCFTEDEYEAFGSDRAWLLDGMDRELILLYCDGDEAEARKLIGFNAGESI